MDKITKERLNILTGVNTTEFFIRAKAVKMVDFISQRHPMLRLYFDSELNSEIEKNALVAMLEPVMLTVDKLTAKGTMANYRNVAVALAQTLSRRMFFAKLIHHVNTGRITIEQFYELAAEYLAAESVNFINKMWDVVGEEVLLKIHGGIHKILVRLNVNPQVAEVIESLLDNITDMANSYVRDLLNQEEIQRFVYKALKIIVESSQKICSMFDIAVDKTKELIHNVKSIGRSICTNLNLEIPEFLKEEEDENVNVKEIDLELEDANGIGDEVYETKGVDIDEEGADIVETGIDIDEEDIDIDIDNDYISNK